MPPVKQADFLFVTYTDRPDKASKGSLRAVRKHVMDDFFRRNKGRDTRRPSQSLHHHIEELLPDNHPESEADAAGSVTNSFSDEAPTVESSTSSLTESYAELPANDDPNASLLPESCIALPTNNDHNWTLPLQQHSPPQLVNPLASSIDVQRTDPFDVLPASGTINQDELLRWLSYSAEPGELELKVPWLSAYNNIYAKQLWHASQDHRGMFHVMMCVGQARRSLVMGQHDRQTLYYHWTLAMRYIREKSSEQDVDDSLLMLISNLARICLADEDSESALTHMKAVQQLTPYSSRLRNLQWRIVTWTDLRLASTILQAPLLPYCSLRADPRHAFPPELMQIAQANAKQSAAIVPPTMPEETADWFLGLWMGSIAYGSRSLMEQPEHLWRSQDVHYHTVYELCRIVAEDELRPFGAPQAILLAMRIYAWTCVPEYNPEYAQIKVCYPPLMKRISKKALNKLHTELSRPESLVLWWKQQDAGLESLLWTLFVAWGIARLECKSHDHTCMDPAPFAGWLVVKLAEVVMELGIDSETGLERALKLFPWVDHFNKGHSTDLWKLITGQGSKAICSSVSSDKMEEELAYDEFLTDEALTGDFEEMDFRQ